MAKNMSIAKLPSLERNDTNLEGKSYTLGKSKLKYKLPPPSLMKPFVDMEAGALETWPAHAGNSNSVPLTMILTKDKRFKVIKEDSCGKSSSVIPKPKFLEQLEKYLKKELQILGVTEIGPSELRLQAYREVFEYLIEDFRTYRPLLASIKNEYEMMMSYQRNVIRQLEPLKQMIVTISEQCDQKIMAIRDEEKQELIDLKAENSRLYEKIADSNNEKLELHSQVEKLQDELAVQYLQYRDECDERKLLIGEYNNLRYEQEDSMQQNRLDAEEDEEEKMKNDPVFLKKALEQARKDEAAASLRLNEMEANYGDVIPRRDMEKLQRDHIELVKHFDILKNDFAKIKHEHEILQQVHKETVHQRDEYFTDAESLRRNATPRPDWDACADFIAGGAKRWKQLSDNKSTKQKVKVLLNEVAGAASGESAFAGPEYFDGLGVDPLVPSYLRFDGQIKNRRLSKRDAALLIKDIWRQKTIKEAEIEETMLDSDMSLSDLPKISMSDFVAEFLASRFPSKQMVAEWAYNLRNVCQRLTHDPKIGLFGFILEGEADEELYHYDYEILERVRSNFAKNEEEAGGPTTITKVEFLEGLKKQFPDMEDKVHEETLKCALTDLAMPQDTTDPINYQDLFTEDDEGNMSSFAEEIVKLVKLERIKYVDEIIEELKKDDENPVSIKSVKKAFSNADPQIDIDTMTKYLQWIFKLPKEDLKSIDNKEEDVTIDSAKLFNRLKLGNIRKVEFEPKI